MFIDYSKRIFGLDIIRAVAISLVLLSHSTLLVFPNNKTLLITVIQFFGTVGVDLFFVLSGYLIGGILLKQLEAGKIHSKDFCYFWVRRWFRTLPNYMLVLVLNILLLYVLKGEVINGIILYPVFLQNLITEHPDFFTEAWSLSIEEYAYLIGPLVLFILLKLFKKTAKQKLFLAMVIIIILLSILFRIHFEFHQVLDSLQEWSHRMRKVVIYRLDAVYYGFLGAFLMSKYPKVVSSYKNVFLGVGLILFVIIHCLIFLFKLQLEIASVFYTVYYLPCLSLCILLLFPFCIHLKTVQSIKESITKVSILSYGVYLLNYSIILLTLQYFINVEQLMLIPKVLLLFLFWFLSFSLAYLLYMFYEKPLTDLRDSKSIKSRFSK